jgi:hypothetical protein
MRQNGEGKKIWRKSMRVAIRGNSALRTGKNVKREIWEAEK